MANWFDATSQQRSSPASSTSTVRSVCSGYSHTGQSLDGARQSLDRAGQSLDGAGQSLDGSGQSLDGAGQSLDGAGQSLDGAGQSLDRAGHPGSLCVYSWQTTSSRSISMTPDELAQGDVAGHISEHLSLSAETYGELKDDKTVTTDCVKEPLKREYKQFSQITNNVGHIASVIGFFSISMYLRLTRLYNALFSV